MENKVQNILQGGGGENSYLTSNKENNIKTPMICLLKHLKMGKFATMILRGES